MSGEQDNALAIARLEGDRSAVRAEMAAMESRIDASLTQLRQDNADRDKQLLVAIGGIVGLATAILCLLIGVLALT